MSGTARDQTCVHHTHFYLKSYRNVKIVALENLLTDAILGQDFLKPREVVKICFGDIRCPLSLGALKCV